MKGVLLVNLGSPKSPTPKDLKPYLEEFLMDERVIDFPKWLRTILVKGIILKTRPRRSAKAYKKIQNIAKSKIIFADLFSENNCISIFYIIFRFNFLEALQLYFIKLMLKANFNN